MTVRPILFSTPMIRALLDGRKSMTRRIVKPQPDLFETEPGVPCQVRAWHDTNSVRIWKGEGWSGQGTGTGVLTNQSCPHGKPGDLLWVRERAHYGPDRVAYSADNPALAHGEKVDGWGPARPSIHMPRWASRLTLELTDVRVERLQDMEGQHPSESDAIAEGVNKIHHGDGAYYYSAFRNEPHPKNWCDPTDAFRELWEKLNGNGSWDLNPWVWVLSFKVHHANVDAVLAQRAEVAA